MKSIFVKDEPLTIISCKNIDENIIKLFKKNFKRHTLSTKKLKS